MEHTSDLVAEGKLIGEMSYGRRTDRWQQIAIDGIKIDHFDPKERIVREVKKSSKKEYAHVAQVKYYLFVLESNGINCQYGLLEYPKEKQVEKVFLTDEDRQNIQSWIKQVKQIIQQEYAPDRIQKSKCRKCSYFDFCWIEE